MSLLANSGLAMSSLIRTSTLVPSQLGDTFLSSKHQDYLAAIAEHSSAKRAA